ncbi:MAG: cellulase family glycosylhydrolase [Hamadaea sp.]|nr:cellulase family glycosylhydrolase [Hamadaea sp.]
MRLRAGVLAVALFLGVLAPAGPAHAVTATGFVYRNGSTLMLDGLSYQFVGFNAYGMAGCATGSAWTAGQMDAYFAGLPPLSMTRVWAFAPSLSPVTTTALDLIVAKAAAHRQKVIFSLADGPSNCEKDGANNPAVNDSGKTRAWYQTGYQTVYLPWVAQVAQRYSTSPAVGMWEIMNEPGHRTSIASADKPAFLTEMRSFFDTVAAAIKNADPNHLVESGTLAEYTNGTTDYAYVHGGPNVDVGSLHEYDYDYDGNSDGVLDRAIVSPHLAPTRTAMQSIDKPLIIGESGVKAGAGTCSATNYSTGAVITYTTDVATRAGAILQKFDSYLAQSGVSGVLVWNRSLADPTGCGLAVGPSDPAIAAITGYLPPGSWSAAPTGQVRIQARNSGKCLDVSGHSLADGAALQQYTCWTGLNQKFTFAAANAYYYRVQGVESGKCLDAQTAAENTQVVQWTCGSGGSQSFRLVPTGDGYLRLVEAATARCLTIAGVSTADAARLVLSDCTDLTHQQFSFV